MNEDADVIMALSDLLYDDNCIAWIMKSHDSNLRAFVLAPFNEFKFTSGNNRKSSSLDECSWELTDDSQDSFCVLNRYKQTWHSRSPQLFLFMLHLDKLVLTAPGIFLFIKVFQCEIFYWKKWMPQKLQKHKNDRKNLIHCWNIHASRSLLQILASTRFQLFISATIKDFCSISLFFASWNSFYRMPRQEKFCRQ